MERTRCWCWTQWQLLHKPGACPRCWLELPDGGRKESLGRVRHWKRGKLKAKVLGLAFYRQESGVTALGTNPITA